jgi:ABC-type sugar transport system ATPase subunit
VHDLSDRVLVLLHGQMVANLRPQDVGVDDLVRWITGVALEGNAPVPTRPSG